MTLRFTTTAELARSHGVKMCVHGRGGAGKTTLIQTLPSPIVLSAESGVLSLGHVAIPAIPIGSFAEAEEAYNFIAYSEHARHFLSVALDSITEIAEVCLKAEKNVHKDGRAAYGEMNEKMADLIRKFRDLPGRHVYFSAQQGVFVDEMSHVTRYGPSMPGKKLTGQMPYFFDEVFSLEVGKTPEGADFRYLRTKLDLQYEAKDRSGALETFEPPHLGQVIEKILARAAA